MRVLLDTHIWLWWLLGDENLFGRERTALDKLAYANGVCISWASIWETEQLERKGRITLEPDFTTWITYASKPEISVVLPVDVDVVVAQRELSASFHLDPADRLITTTAILSGYPLATRDRRIQEQNVCKIWSP